jgi:hypothetical protein
MARDDLLIRSFLADDMTRKACEDSEIFMNYARSEMARERAENRKIAEKIEQMAREEDIVLTQLDDFRKKVAENPALAKKLKQAKVALEADPELAKKVDPNFIEGIKLLNLED